MVFPLLPQRNFRTSERRVSSTRAMEMRSWGDGVYVNRLRQPSAASGVHPGGHHAAVWPFAGVLFRLCPGPVTTGAAAFDTTKQKVDPWQKSSI
jgi:hypothetical protein